MTREILQHTVEVTSPSSRPVRGSAPSGAVSIGSRATDVVWSALTGRLPVSLTIVAWSALVLFFALVFIARLAGGTMIFDEGILLTYPWVMNHGLLPYRDFWAGYPPGGYAVLAFLFRILGESQVIERVIGGLFWVGIILLVNRMLTGSWFRFSLIGTPTVATLLFFGGSQPFALTMSVPFLLAGLWWVRRPPLAALFFLIGAMFRWEVGVIGLIALGIYGVILSLHARRLCLRVFLTGSILLLVALALSVAVLQALTGEHAIDQFVVYQIVTGQAARTLALVPPKYGVMPLPLAMLVLLGPPIMALVAWLRRSPVLVATNVALMGDALQFLHRADALHLAFVAVVIVPWLLYSLAELFAPLRQHEARLAAAARSVSTRWNPVAGAIVLLMGLYIGGYIALRFAYGAARTDRSLAMQGVPNTVHLGSRTIQANDPIEAQDTAALASYLTRHAAPRDRIFAALIDNRRTMANSTVLYFVLDRRPCSKYLEFEPGLESASGVQRQIIGSLSQCRWIVLWKHGWQYEPNTSHNFGSNRLNVYLQQHYRTVLNNSTYQLRRRCTGAGSNCGGG